MLSRWELEAKESAKAFVGASTLRDEESARFKRELVLVTKERDFKCARTRDQVGDGHHRDHDPGNPTLPVRGAESVQQVGAGLWPMHHRPNRHTLIRVVEMAVWQRWGDGSVILHSDHGSQFVSGTTSAF